MAKKTISISVEEKLKALYDLQCVDSEIDQLRIVRGELPVEIQDLEDEIVRLRTVDFDFKDYNKKPPLCSPQSLPCFSYSSAEELENLFNSLIIQGKPTKEYIEMLLLQRQWLWRHGTTEARALDILKTINEQLSN